MTKPKMHYIAIFKTMPWSSNEQIKFHGSLESTVSFAKKLAMEHRTEVRISETPGYNNQGHYIHFQQLLIQQ